MLPISVFLGILIVVVLATTSTQNIFENQGLEIVDGDEVDISQHPWQVALQGPGGTFYCSAFLISTEWLLTSAYCMVIWYEEDIPRLWVRAGSNQYRYGGQAVHLERVIVHPDFEPFWYINDIALVHLVSNITDPIARPVNLPEPDEELENGTMISVAGWGAMTQEGGEYSPVLREIQVPIIDRDLCNDTNTHEVLDYMMCAGYLDIAGTDVCIGDMGAPATIGDVAYGLTTWNAGCGTIGFPSVYIQISKFRQWIKETTGI